MRARKAVLAVLLLALLVASPTHARMVLNRGTAGDPDTLDPHVSAGNSSAILLYDFFLPLMTLDARGDIAPGAAESYTVAADGLSYVFKLRPGLKWSDGTPLTAEDFVYSFRRIQEPATAARYAQFFWPVKNARAINEGKAPADALGVSAPDALTVRFDLEAPSPVFLEIVSTYTSAPVPRHVIETFGREWTAPEHFVSNGAYVMTSREPQTRIGAVKNRHFYDAERVRIDEVNYFPTQNLGTVLNRFRAGELDVALNFPPEQIDWIKTNLGRELHISPTLGAFLYVFNTRRPPFDDVRVRRALSMAVDRQGMIAKLLNTGVTPADSLVPPVLSNYVPAQPSYAAATMSARLAEARRLLTEAGYSPERPLVFTIHFDTLEESRKMAVALAAMWRPLGVRAELADSEFRDLTRRAKTGDFELVRWAYFSPLADASSYLNLMRTGDASNFSGFADASFDALMAEINAGAHQPRRAALMREAERRVLEAQPVMPIYHYAGRRLIQTYVGNWIDNPRNANLARYLTVDRPR